MGVLSTQANLHSIPGPNCLNTALVYTNVLKYPRYTSNQEMLLYLKSNLCHEVSLTGKRQKNDIQIIIDKRPLAQKDIISHAYVYVSPEVMFEKIGFAVEAGYRYMKESEILSEYEVDFQDLTVKSYRCQSLTHKDLLFIESLEREFFYFENNFNAESFVAKVKKTVLLADTVKDTFIRDVIYQRALSIIFQLGIVDRKYQNNLIDQLIFSKASNSQIAHAIRSL